MSLFYGNCQSVRHINYHKTTLHEREKEEKGYKRHVFHKETISDEAPETIYQGLVLYTVWTTPTHFYSNLLKNGNKSSTITCFCIAVDKLSLTGMNAFNVTINYVHE